MATFLQNHPAGLNNRGGGRDLPVRPGRASAALTSEHEANSGWRVWSGIALFFGLIAAVAGGGDRVPGAARAVVVVVLLLLYVTALLTWRVWRPIWAQRRYYAAAGVSAPDERERAALRIVGVRGYVRRWWPFTIEPYALAERVGGAPARRFSPLVLVTQQDVRDDLARSWGILHEVGARQAIDRALTRGVRSEAFAREARTTSVSDWDDLAAVSGVPLGELVDLTREVDGRAPGLLWGADLLEAHTLIRTSLCAGYLSREEALVLLERVTGYAAALFPTEESFLRSVNVGLAVANGPGEMALMREWREDAARYRASEWPAKLGPWPTPTGHEELPPAMATGFRADQ